MDYNILNDINTPSDLKKLSHSQMSILSEEIRHFLIDNVTKTGGHLAPNLGVVELTIALHYVFKSPKDSFIWDVGHQSYVHKILTDRKHLFPTLRQKNGLSGFPCPKESPHDIIHSGHSSTSVSLGVGVATAKKLKNDPTNTIAIVGDGSFTGGMVYEALNDASWRHLPLIIVLNDNKMSISENVGGIAKHLNILRTNRAYLSLKKVLARKLPSTAFGKWIFHLLFALKSSIKNLIFKQQNIFENLGVKYLGPFDGHDLPRLISLFKQIKDTKEPLLLHIITEKGRGHEDSQNDPTNFHGISGERVSPQEGISWSNAFGQAVTNLAQKDDDVVVITAAMREGTGLVEYSQKFPKRFIDVGIAEQHAVTCAVGLAIQGKKPIVAIYSTFLQRAYDQILHDVAIANLPVKLCLDRAGLVPGDGSTHQGIFDIAYLRTIPNMIIMSPLNSQELQLMLECEFDSPVAIRYPKDIAPSGEATPIELGKGVELVKGKDGVVVIFGSLYDKALSIHKELQNHQKNFAIYHLRFAKPIHHSTIEYLKQYQNIVVLEEGISSIGEYLKNQLEDRDVLLYNVGDEFPDVDMRESLIDTYFNTQKIIQDIIKK